MKKKKLVWIVIALLAAGGLSAYLATRKGPPPVMKTDPLGGPEARVVLRLTKEGMDAAKNAVKGLKSAAGFVRHNLGRRVQLRYTPELLFELDTTIEYGVHIASLINQVRKTEGSQSDEDV